MPTPRSDYKIFIRTIDAEALLACSPNSGKVTTLCLCGWTRFSCIFQKNVFFVSVMMPTDLFLILLVGGPIFSSVLEVITLYFTARVCNFPGQLHLSIPLVPKYCDWHQILPI